MHSQPPKSPNSPCLSPLIRGVQGDFGNFAKVGVRGVQGDFGNFAKVGVIGNVYLFL